jgi:hypothetical protein
MSFLSCKTPETIAAENANGRMQRKCYARERRWLDGNDAQSCSVISKENL